MAERPRRAHGTLHRRRRSTVRRLRSGTQIRVATPLNIIATKLAAWHGRVNNDMLRSLDLHDILVLTKANWSGIVMRVDRLEKR